MTGVTPVAVRNWARRLVRASVGVEPLALVRSVVAQVAAAGGLDAVADAVPALAGARLDRHESPPGGWSNPWLPGVVHEQAVSAGERRARGAWYTPEPVVRGLVALATIDRDPPPAAVDPTCGGGAFLLAVLDRYVELGVAPADALGRVAGLDLDPGAIEVARWSLLLWAERRGVDPVGLELDLAVGDALTVAPEGWPPVRLVVGNPPFATPLRSGTVPDVATAYREEQRHLLGPYSDLAAVHLARAVAGVGAGSTVAMIQPQSILAGRDTAGLRRHYEGEGRAPIHALWAARQSVFDAGVRPCAVVVRPGAARPDRVALAAGPDVAAQGWSAPTAWAGLAVTALGGPTLPGDLARSASADEPGSAERPESVPAAAPAARAERLGALITATAGFRDEYYGLVDACREWSGDPGAAPNRLTTVGMVEPLASAWGRSKCKFGGRRWAQPIIDLDALDDKVGRWTRRQLRPKVVLATQSRILEPLVDADGVVVPATPLLAVHGRVDDLAHVAAVLLAPPVVAWAWTRWFGTAMAVDALKLAATQVGELPLPGNRVAWSRAAALVADRDGEPELSVEDGLAVSAEVAAVMNEAYGADAAVLRWWIGRTALRGEAAPAGSRATEPAR